MFLRSTLKQIARLAFAAMLFAQAALAFAACESAWRTPVLAIMFTEQRIDGENCHEPAINANLCLVHCLGEDQTLDKPLVKVPALPVALVSFNPLAFAPHHQAGALQRPAVPHAAGPPLRILFQSLLI